MTAGPERIGEPDDRIRVPVGGRSRAALMDELRTADVLLNTHAETLLAALDFDGFPARVLVVEERTVAELGFAGGATLPEILESAADHGLALCPVEAGPFLRLAIVEQLDAGESARSSGTAPVGSLTIASAALSADDAFPKGFYLRVVDGRRWLRGYRCDADHQWSPGDRFLFSIDDLPSTTEGSAPRGPIVSAPALRNSPGGDADADAGE
jgi:hypothetical protein